MTSLLKSSLILIILLLACKKDSNSNYPNWLAEEPIKSLNRITKGPYKASRNSYDQAISSTKNYRYLIYSYPKNEYYPYWLYNLSINLDNLDLNTLALKELNKLSNYIDTTIFPKDIKRIKSLNELKDLPLSIRLKALAKARKTTQFQKAIESYTPASNYSLFKIAEAYMFLNEKDKSLQYLKEAIKIENHLRAHKRISTTAGAVGLAYTSDLTQQIDTLASWVYEIDSNIPPQQYSRLNSKGLPDAYSKRQWQSSQAIIHKFKELASYGNKSFGVGVLKDGIYQGTCQGFIDTVKVNVEFNKNKIKNIEVVKSKEDRPNTSLITIPNRIIKSQSLQVDAITGATITSYAIIGAVAEATLKAQKTPNVKH